VSPARSGRQGTLAIGLLIVAWFAATAWARPLLLPDEGRYVGVAWEMLRSGDWLTPTLNGLPFFHKPPLMYWLTAASMAVFGMNEWAARAAPIVGASVGSLALYLLTRRWSGAGTARAALVALLAQPLFAVGGQFANLDMLVAGCITATIALAAHAVLAGTGDRPDRRALAAAYAMAGLGILAKGLIGVVLPALVLTTWLIAVRRWRALLRLIWWPGLLLAVAVAAPWFVAMQLRFAGFFDYFFVVQHFQRFTAAGGFNNALPLWFYPAVLLAAALPWWRWLWQALRPGAPRPASTLRPLMWSWLAAITVFFSLPASKLVGYILPAVPPLAWLLADGLESLRAGSGQPGRGWWAAAFVGVAASLAVVVGLTLRPPASAKPLGLELARRQAAGEPVLMLGRYDYDLPFYARLRQPVQVVDDWDTGDAQQRDNWRKELADAGRFDPARAGRTLLTAEALPATLCAAPVSWIVAKPDQAHRWPWLAQADQVERGHDAALWRLDSRLPTLAGPLNCAGKPNAG